MHIHCVNPTIATYRRTYGYLHFLRHAFDDFFIERNSSDTSTGLLQASGYDVLYDRKTDGHGAYVHTFSRHTFTL